MSCTNKELIQITDEIYILESDLSSMEFQAYASAYWGRCTKEGTILVMKSGRKLFAEGLTPKQVSEKLKSVKPAKDLTDEQG